MADKRTTLILNYIKQNKRATLQELCELFPSYSTMTIRRDLILLEKNGYIRRFHGGAELCGDAMADLYNYQQRKASALKEKQYIAMRAAELLEESSSIYIDAGTTMLEMVKILPDMPLFITTNDPFVLFEGLKKTQFELFLTGGSLNKSVVSLSGPIALDTIDKVNIDTAFIGAAGFSAEHGFTNALYNECELKKKVISEAKRIIVLLDSRKFHKSLPYTFANISDIDILVTNQALPPDLQQLCQGHGVRVIA